MGHRKAPAISTPPERLHKVLTKKPLDKHQTLWYNKGTSREGKPSTNPREERYDIMTNITNRIALSAVIASLSDSYTYDHVTTDKEGLKTTTTFTASEIKEKLSKMIEQLDKKASAPKKPTAKQTESAEQATKVLELLRQAGKAVTVSELIEMFPAELAGMSNQKVASLLRSMLDGAVVRTEEKRKAYFKAVQ